MDNLYGSNENEVDSDGDGLSDQIESNCLPGIRGEIIGDQVVLPKNFSCDSWMA